MGGIPKQTIVLYAMLACLCGIVFGSFFSVSFFVLFCVCVSCMVCIIVVTHKRIRYLCIYGIFFCIGIWRVLLVTQHEFDSSHVAFYNGTSMTITGVVQQEPDVRLDHQKLTIGVTGSQPTTSVRTGLVLVTAPLYPAYRYGDVVAVRCDLTSPEPIEDFSYDRYLARYHVYSVCWRGNITLIDTHKGTLLMTHLLWFKEQSMEHINRIIAEPYAAFLAGLLVGARRGIPEYILEAFSRTGVTHIIAISGSNITIISAVCIGFLRYLGIHHKRAFWITSVGILLFVLLTGASASVVRAGIMGMLVLFSTYVGRTSRMTNGLVFTASVMCLWNPLILVYDVGFQLSFLATIGIVYIQPVLSLYLARVSSVFGLKDALVTTVSAMITTTPLIVYQFGRISIIAPLANVLILPAIPLTMAIGFMATVISFISISLAQFIVAPAWLLLAYMIQVAEKLSDLSFASIMIPSFHWTILVAFYIALWWWVRSMQAYAR